MCGIGWPTRHKATPADARTPTLYLGVRVRRRRAFWGQFVVMRACSVRDRGRPDPQNSLKTEQVLRHPESLTSNQTLAGAPIRYIFLLYHPRDIPGVLNMLQYDSSPD